MQPYRTVFKSAQMQTIAHSSVVVCETAGIGRRNWINLLGV